MTTNAPAGSTGNIELAVRESHDARYALRLFVTGMTPRSQRAIENIKRVCEAELKDRYSLEVVDLYQHPELAGAAQIIAAPTLVKELPLPLRRIIGDLSNNDKVLVGLDLQKKG